MPKMYKCNLDCVKKNAKGWCIDTFAKVDEDGKCDSQKIPIAREQKTLGDFE